jgi:glycosyltransferase involved in cell wall biosynthesis
LPWLIARDEIGEMKTTLAGITKPGAFDVIHADQLSMASYGIAAARMTRHPSTRALLDEHNAVHVLAERIARHETRWLWSALAAREARAFARYEVAMCRAYDALLTVTAEDRDRLMALFLPDERAAIAAKTTVIPIAIDPTRVAPVNHRPAPAPTLLHIGTMFWPPNVAGVLWFVREVLPLIHRKLPTTRLVVVGKNPPKAVRSLASDPRIEITGYVADPGPHLTTSDAVVVPLHAGSGLRVKILDAWLRGMPVVSTSIGAEGLRIRDGENILIADAPASFAGAVVRVLADPALSLRLRTNGRRWVETHYSRDVVYGAVDRVYEKLVGAGTRTAG